MASVAFKMCRVRLPEVTTLEGGRPLTGLRLEAGYWRYYRVVVPEGQRTLVISASGEAGDLDLFVRKGSLPTLHEHERQSGTRDDQPCAHVRVENPAPGEWFIGLLSWNYEGVTLCATFGGGDGQSESPLTEALQSCCDTVLAPDFQRAKSPTPLRALERASG